MSNGRDSIPQQRVQVRINLDDLKGVACPACNSLIFKTGHALFRTLPMIQSPTNRPQLIRIDLITCATCGNAYQIRDDKLQLIAEETPSEETP